MLWFLPSSPARYRLAVAIDLGASYRAARLRVAVLVNDDLADRSVPATPDWNVHAVVSHLYGVLTDVSSGNLEGVTTAPWTSAQVERCRGKSVAQVIEERAAIAPGFETFLSSPAGSSSSVPPTIQSAPDRTSGRLTAAHGALCLRTQAANVPA